MAYGNLLTDVVQSSTTSTPPTFKDGGGTEIGTLCRAWVNFDSGNGGGTNGQIYGSFNVSSITVNGTGDYTANFTNAMPNANYSFTFGSSDVPTINSAVTAYYGYITTTSIRFVVSNLTPGGYTSRPRTCIAIHR